MTFFMKVYHAIYSYFFLDAFSMNDVNKADMTEKESKIISQVLSISYLFQNGYILTLKFDRKNRNSTRFD